MNRGWYLAIEYPILSATPDFQRRLESTRKLGRFQELLEDDGSITFRNLLRADQLKDAWNILNALQAWKAKVQLYLNGSPISWKLASDIAWCAGYLVGEDPCYGDAKARRLEIGCENKLQFAPFHWSRREDKRRHVISFARLAPDLGLRFDVDGILEFLGRSQLARDCPVSPIHQRERWEQALKPVSLNELGWQRSLSLAKRHRLSLGENYKTREHSFLPKSHNHGLLGQVPLELRLLDGQPTLFKLEDSQPFATELFMDSALREVLAEGLCFRVWRQRERFSMDRDRPQEIEQVFTLEDELLLGPEDQRAWPGYDLTAIPQNTPKYNLWLAETLEVLHRGPEELQPDEAEPEEV